AALARVLPWKYEGEVVDLVAEVEWQCGQAQAIARRTQGDRGRIAIERLDQHHAVERAQRRQGGWRRGPRDRRRTARTLAEMTGHHTGLREHDARNLRRLARVVAFEAQDG